ncbi:hypothetical protein [Chroogloeocystis siderophila]|jgi:hypothetical protein|uniref:DUF4394 domain-containing protein n=1 Tax=Chroogloeocystis siderophila 5.2 s.c.1 TaxID=247279 RepID=A0A1U7HGB5_9CHRO|nr:hypothetical protein [Chroogloeocystis siderophila]OKH22642.1 hypothetical protein NIES1031_19495 [Chroogloeocystis siderophila 5.2 s.c.1]
MNLRIRRRRFGQIAIASAAATALGSFAKRTLAQTGPILYGVTVDSTGTNLIIQALNLATGNLLPTNIQRKLETNERISGFTSLPNGRFAIATGPATSLPGRGVGRRSRLISSSAQNLPEPQGLDANAAFESILNTTDNRLLSIVSLNQGTPPFRFANVDRQSGRVTYLSDIDLRPNRRYSNLSQSPKGNIYGTLLGPDGGPTLVQFDFANRSIVTGKAKIIPIAQLTYNKRPLFNDVASLALSPSNQLFALADPTYEGTNSLFSVNIQTGEMTFLRKFAVQKITFTR